MAIKQCGVCNGNNRDMPCAYPRNSPAGCLRNSEQWRMECEAREVLKRYPMYTSREQYYQQLVSKRGQASVQALANEVKRQRAIHVQPTNPRTLNEPRPGARGERR